MVKAVEEPPEPKVRAPVLDPHEGGPLQGCSLPYPCLKSFLLPVFSIKIFNAPGSLTGLMLTGIERMAVRANLGHNRPICS